MKRSNQCSDREKIVADAIWPVATELRMLEVADLIAMLRFERHAELADLVASAAELFFLPGTVRLGMGGDYRLDWSGDTRVVIDLEIRPPGVAAFVRLTLEDEHGGVEIDHILFDDPQEDHEANTEFLAATLSQAAYRPIPQALVCACNRPSA